MPWRLVVARHGPFIEPGGVPGLAAWYDASNESTITSLLGVVSGWADLSPNAFNLSQPNVLASPATGSRTQNGRNVLTFAGANNLLNSAVSVTATNTGTWFAVMKPSSTVNFGRLLSLDAGANDFDNTSSIAAILNDGGSWGSYYNGSARALQPLSDAVHQFTVLRNGDAESTWLDGSAGSGATGLGTTNFGFTRLFVGADHTGTFYTGDLAELIWYNAAVSTVNRVGIQNYLKQKWATP